MKKTILIIMFILFLPLAFALYGGETWSYHFDKCDTLEVNITATGTIDEGEYTILNNCTENQTNYYICDCNDNYDFNVSFKINAVNKYTFNFSYIYSEVTQEQPSSSGRGGSTRRKKECISDWNCTKWTNCQPNSKAIRSCIDLNNCSNEKPFEERSCYFYIPKEEQIKLEEPINETEEDTETLLVETEEDSKEVVPQTKKNQNVFILVIFIIIIILIIIIFYVLKWRKNQ